MTSKLLFWYPIHSFHSFPIWWSLIIADILSWFCISVSWIYIFNLKWYLFYLFFILPLTKVHVYIFPLTNKIALENARTTRMLLFIPIGILQTFIWLCSPFFFFYLFFWFIFIAFFFFDMPIHYKSYTGNQRVFIIGTSVRYLIIILMHSYIHSFDLSYKLNATSCTRLKKLKRRLSMCSVSLSLSLFNCLLQNYIGGYYRCCYYYRQ